MFGWSVILAIVRNAFSEGLVLAAVFFIIQTPPVCACFGFGKPSLFRCDQCGSEDILKSFFCCVFILLMTSVRLSFDDDDSFSSDATVIGS